MIAVCAPSPSVARRRQCRLEVVELRLQRADVGEVAGQQAGQGGEQVEDVAEAELAEQVGVQPQVAEA